MGHRHIILINRLIFIPTCLVLLMNVNTTKAQCDRYSNASVEGVFVKGASCFKKRALLLQDTCTEWNKFTNSLIYPNLTYDTTTLKSVIVDEKMFHRVEINLCKEFKNIKKLRRCFRLYVGCVDSKGDTCVIVQFVKAKEFFSNKLYSRQLNLLLGPKDSFSIAYFILKNNRIYFLRGSCYFLTQITH